MLLVSLFSLHFTFIWSFFLPIELTEAKTFWDAELIHEDQST